MMAQRTETTDLPITAIEIVKVAAEQAAENAAASPWSHRIDVQPVAFEEYLDDCPNSQLEYRYFQPAVLR